MEVSTRETPAGFSRILHRHVKAMHAELRAVGYPEDTIYTVLLDVMMRLAYEQTGDDGVVALLAQVKREGMNVI